MSHDWYLQESLSLGLGVGENEYLLSHESEEDGARQGLDDGDVVIRVHLFHDQANVADGQTVEDVHKDDDDEKDEESEDDVAEPVGEVQVGRVVELSDEHYQGLDEGDAEVGKERVDGHLDVAVGRGRVVGGCPVDIC